MSKENKPTEVETEMAKAIPLVEELHKKDQEIASLRKQLEEAVRSNAILQTTIRVQAKVLAP